MPSRQNLLVRPIIAALALVFLAGCSDATVTGPSRALASAVQSVGATHQHVEFDAFDDFDTPLSCLDGEMTHWEGPIHVTIDLVTAPSGNVNTSVALVFGSAYFIERANGVRYYPVAGFPVHEHHTDGPLTLITGTAAGVFQSATGETLPLGFHVQVLYDPNSNTIVDWKWTGACP